MPSIIRSKRDQITKFTNCRLIKDNGLIYEDLLVSSGTGKIIRNQEAFYSHHLVPDVVINLKGRIIAPGFIDVQLNGAFGFDFSKIPQDSTTYGKRLRSVNKLLVQTGVTSYLPTLTSQKQEVYHKALPYLGPSGATRLAEDGAESLGAHCEGPFLNPSKNGIHAVETLATATTFKDIEDCYGTANINMSLNEMDGTLRRSRIKMITAAPEVGNMSVLIPEITSRDIIYSIGHSEATYEDAAVAVRAGAMMITHLFNAMKPLHHRNPGIFGVLGIAESLPRPYFGVIADSVHLHPTSVKIAYNAFPDGFILVTDAMHLAGCQDGIYEWTNGENIVKCGPRLTLQGSDKIAGSSITLIECVNNFLKWSRCSISQALKAVTVTPAAMLGCGGVKGTLACDADADLVILDDQVDASGEVTLSVEEVWKFGVKVFDVFESG